jgi:hypothetical protein
MDALGGEPGDERRAKPVCEVMQQADGVTSQPTTQGAQQLVARRGQGACQSARLEVPLLSYTSWAGFLTNRRGGQP